MNWIRYGIDVVFHLDRYLNVWAAGMGSWLYVLLFAIVFCETGLLVLPFLPGDSLLFAVGALASGQDSTINLPVAMVVLVIAAVVGDAVNYSLGARLGPKVFSKENSWLLNRKHLLKAQQFYEKHGGKTIVLARFVPIIRTFAPFVAGVGQMRYSRFALYNVTGAVTWVVSLSLAGYFFGQMPMVKNNFELVVLAIILISVLPVVVEYLRHWWSGRKVQTRPAEQKRCETGPGKENIP